MRSQTILARVAAGSVAAALLMSGALVASAQTGTTDTNGTTGVTGTNGTNGGATNQTGTNQSGDTMTNPGGTGTNNTDGGTATTPGVPNTGLGGDAAATLALLTISGLAAVGGALYLSRRGMAARI